MNQRVNFELDIVENTLYSSCLVGFPLFIMGSRDGAVVEHLPPMQTSQQCGPGSIPGLSLLLVLVLGPRGFSPGTP